MKKSFIPFKDSHVPSKLGVLKVKLPSEELGFIVAKLLPL